MQNKLFLKAADICELLEVKQLEEFYMLEKETEKSDARKVAVLMKGYLIVEKLIELNS